jgi:hypothetical protein
VDSPASTISRESDQSRHSGPSSAADGDTSATVSNAARQSGSGAQSSCNSHSQGPGSPQRCTACVTAAPTAAPNPVPRGRVSTPSSTRAEPSAASARISGVRSVDPVSTATTCLGRSRRCRSADRAGDSQGAPSWQTSTASTGAVRSRGRGRLCGKRPLLARGRQCRTTVRPRRCYRSAGDGPVTGR